MRYVLFITTCVIYTFVLLGVYLLHINYFNVEVVLFAAIKDGVIAALLTFGLLFFLFGKLFQFQTFEWSIIFCVWLLGGYSFAITGPTVLDRSLSFFTLEKIQLRGGLVHKDEIGEIFLEYIPEVRLVDVRMTEQLQSRTIVRQGDCFKLTKRGEKMVEFSRFVRKNLLAKHRLLDGKYTNFLTRPSDKIAMRSNLRC